MKLISQIFCLFAMCCQLLVATGFLYHTHECEDTSCHLISFETTELFNESSCCSHDHKFEDNTKLLYVNTVERHTHAPHNHPCDCKLPSQLIIVGAEATREDSRNKVVSDYLAVYTDIHCYKAQNPSQAPPQNLFYIPPLLDSSGATLIHIHCTYLI